MYKGKTTIGIITARGGSKGIARKNIALLCGKPLIHYSIEAAKASKHLTRCIVSTEDQEIARIASAAGAEVPFTRPSALAQDESTTIDVLQHALRWLKDTEGKTYDYVLVLQPTSPLRLVTDIDACIAKITETNADSVMSMVQLHDFSVKKLKKIEDDRILPLLEEEGKFSESRRASIPVYKRNTAIYLTRTDLILRGEMFGALSRPYVMPSERSVDINEPHDLDLAEFWMRKLRLYGA